MAHNSLGLQAGKRFIVSVVCKEASGLKTRYTSHYENEKEVAREVENKEKRYGVGNVTTEYIIDKVQQEYSLPS